MAQEERYGTRDQSYSAWHRRGSTRRFVGIEKAQLLAMIDLDCALYVEYDDRSKEPIALIEIARDVGQEYKPATVTKRLARRCVPELRAYTLLYRQAETPNPADPRERDIACFRVRRIWPEPETDWKMLSPAEWAALLLEIRERAGHPLNSGEL